ncbi:ABC transporter permease [Bifidobacterium pongonis]|uniref:ABC transporter permease n=1 Tax=Bifidobacterium pongonis TaxID=2834432 RepID=UPI001F2F1529|nr:ABC transporter permease [Bifidobacterium pongonis]
MTFHEPWFDEAQSWLIARDASFRDMLLVRPHYEGHPPLWWLMLSIPAKLGVPYEIGLKSVQFVCAALMAWMLVFRSPFPPLAAGLLPFTYFMCFQYGVTSRPYALMCAAMFLTAECWNSRDEKPWRLTLSLILLCCTSSYGIALACAMALVWVVRVLRESRSVRSLIARPERFVAWLLLLVVGFVLTVSILPYPDTFGMTPGSGGNSAIMQFLMFWLIMPSEALFTSFAGDVSLHGLRMGVFPIVLCVVLSAMVWYALGRLARRRGDLDILLLPYVLFALCATKYFSLHHLGILFALFVADLWILVRDRPIEADDAPEWLRRFVRACVGRVAGKRVGKSGHSGDYPAAQPAAQPAARPTQSVRFGRIGHSCRAATASDPAHPRGAIVRNCVIILLLLPSLWWNIAAGLCDLRYDYSGSRAVASFAERNDFTHNRWVSVWRYFPETTWSDGSHTPRQEDTHRYAWAAIAADPYLGRGVWSVTERGSARAAERGLLDCTYRGRSFEPNQVPTAAQMNREIAACAAKGEPAFVTGETDFPEYYFGRLGYRMRDYRKITIATKRTPWKNWITTTDITAYVRSDVFRTLR